MNHKTYVCSTCKETRVVSKPLEVDSGYCLTCYLNKLLNELGQKELNGLDEVILNKNLAQSVMYIYDTLKLSRADATYLLEIRKEQLNYYKKDE